MTTARKISIALGGALAAIALPAAASAVTAGRLTSNDWIGICLTAGGCGRLLFLILDDPNTSARTLTWQVLHVVTAAIAWLAAAFAWPLALHPGQFPAATLLFVTPWLWLGGRELRAWSGLETSQLEKTYWWPLALVSLGLVTAGLVIYILQVRPFVGDVDFFYYLCYARDINDRAAPIAENRFFYFPGVYAFWCGLMRAGITELAELQRVVLGVLLLNAALVWAIVKRSTGGGLWALFAGLWYLVVCTRFQGTTGVTEPLATVPWLAGILIWNGRSLDRQTPWWQVLSLALAIGLTVCVKQQAGLLSLGAAWFLLRLPNQVERPDWRRIVALPLVAVIVVLLVFLAQGHGLRPLTSGTGAVVSYDGQSSLLTNLYSQFRADPGLAIAAAVCLLALFAPFPLSKSDSRQRDLLGLLMLAAAATLVQFFRRPYHHYMLLAVPAIVISATTLLAVAARRLASTPWRGLGILAGFYICGLVLLTPSAGRQTANPLQFLEGTRKPFPPLWHQQPAVAQDLAELSLHLVEGQRMYVLPPRHNSVYYLLNTRSQAVLGYSFQFPSPAEIPWQQYDTILTLLDPALDPVNRQKWPATTAAAATAELRRNGFRRQRRLATMDLWVRTRNP